jgi:hypothetical protein
MTVGDLAAFQINGTALLGQNDLASPFLSSHIASLDSNSSLLSVLDAIRATVSRSAYVTELKSGPALDIGTESTTNDNSDSSFQFNRTLDKSRYTASPDLDSRTTDTLTGTAANAALVGDSSQDVKINFQPNISDVPVGYTKDIGEAYNDARGFGWVREDSLSSTIHVPLNVTLNSRDRNRVGIDQRLDTLIHMQGNNISNFSGVKIPAAWEYALPDGQYSVTVNVGDQPKYNSTHKINVEGVTAIRPFLGDATHEYELGTVQVNVTDGRLTVDAIGGTNTKINYIEIESVSPGNHPSVSGSSPDSRQIGIGRSAAVNLDVALVNLGSGVDAATLTTHNIQLYRTQDNTLVPGNINTTGGGDAIVYQPSSPLEASTHYTFRLSDRVKDESGNPFLPFSTTFSTGTTTISPTPGVNFNKSVVYSGATISSLAISPNGKTLYAASLDGKLRRWSIDSSSGNLTNLQIFSGLAGRAIIGITFDPQNASVLWLSHNDPLFPQPANDFTGKISKVRLNTVFRNSSVEDYVVGLPRSAKDHLSNSLTFHNGMLYMTQGSNTAMGSPDNAWYQRPERLLSAAVLQIAPRRTPPIGGFNVQTENYIYTDSAGQTVTTTGNYNPYATNAPVRIYATGVRNAYDLLWHGNGSLYVPTNGSAAGGKTPDNPYTTNVNEALTNVATQNDYFFKVDKDGYYGHPNPIRSEYKRSHRIPNPDEYVLNGGNPTSRKDLAEVVDQGSYNGYDIVNDVGIQPEAHWKGFAYDFGRNRSPNGVIEYKSNTFNGVLKNQLLVVEYSGGDDILALKPDVNGNLPSADVTQAASGFTNPLDLIENTLNGNLYVAELVNENTGKGQISLLKPTQSA